MTVVSVQQALCGARARGGEVTVRGWVRTRRDSKAGLCFVNVSDGSCFAPIQVVAPDTLANYESEVKHLTAGCAVIATGMLVASQGQGQSFEIQATRHRGGRLGRRPETYPIQPKAHSLEFLREVAHLRPRTNLFGAVTRIRHCLAQAMHRFFHEQGFYWINTPIITTSDAEGAGQMFRVSTLDMANLPRDGKGNVDFSHDFFGKETFLTVSGQLNVEAYCLALSKVYTFGPTFRAENSNTTRHLAEFWMIEPEIAFADLNDDANLAEAFLKYLFKRGAGRARRRPGVHRRARGQDRDQQLEGFIDAPFERIDYTDAVTLLQKSGQEVRVPGGMGPGPADRARALADRGARRPPGGGDELPRADQGLLHAPERRRQAPSPRWTCWRPASARSSAAASARSAWTCSTRAWRSSAWIRRTTAGTATSAATAPCRTPASASASSGWWSTCAGWPTSATPSPTRARRALRSSDRVDADFVLFLALLAFAIAIAGATAFVIFWPLALVHIRDRHPQITARARRRRVPQADGAVVAVAWRLLRDAAIAT